MPCGACTRTWPRRRGPTEVARKLRVLQVVHSLAPGGTERLVVELVRRLGGEFEMSVCCLDQAGAWGEELRAAGTPVDVLQRRPGFRPGLAWQVAQVCRRRGVDVMHCHQYTPFVYGALAATFLGAPRVVFTEHGRLSDAPPTSRRRLANQFFGRLPRVRMFAVSEDLKRHMVAEGLPAGRIEVVLNGIDPGPEPTAAQRAWARAQLGVREDEIVIGTAARLDPVKDLGTLLRAFAEAQFDRPSRLVVIGDGELLGALQAQAAELGLGPRVVFTGYRPDVRALLPGLDVYVNCSISEGISLTILEAMAAGLPVVATRVGGTPEVVTPETGLLVPSLAPASLARAVERLAPLAGVRGALSGSARLRVKSTFALEGMCAAYRRHYLRATTGAQS